jgi:hypothetical protein
MAGGTRELFRGFGHLVFRLAFQAFVCRWRALTAQSMVNRGNVILSSLTLAA